MFSNSMSLILLILERSVRILKMAKDNPTYFYPFALLLID